jgi:hypothetical protein
MDDSEKPDELLKQVPLVKSPSYQPPKPVTLNTNYEKLIPQLYKSVVPPKFNLTQQDITNWFEEVNLWKARVSIDKSDEDISNFNLWLQKQQLSIAPGYHSVDGIMTPHKVEKVESPTQEQGQTMLPQMNELDRVFGNTTLEDS